MNTFTAPGHVFLQLGSDSSMVDEYPRCSCDVIPRPRSDSSMVDEYLFQHFLVGHPTLFRFLYGRWIRVSVPVEKSVSVVQIPLWSMNTFKAILAPFFAAFRFLYGRWIQGGKGNASHLRFKFRSSMVDEYLKGILAIQNLIGSDSSMVDEYLSELVPKPDPKGSDSSMVDEYPIGNIYRGKPRPGSDSSMVDEYYWAYKWSLQPSVFRFLYGRWILSSSMMLKPKEHVQIPLWSMNTMRPWQKSILIVGSDSSMVDEYHWRHQGKVERFTFRFLYGRWIPLMPLCLGTLLSMFRFLYGRWIRKQLHNQHLRQARSDSSMVDEYVDLDETKEKALNRSDSSMVDEYDIPYTLNDTTA